MATLTLSDAEAGQVLLHVDQAAQAAAGSDSPLAGAEALLAWAILTAKGEPVPDQGTTIEVAPTRRGIDEQIRQVQQQALDSAYALIGHFVGEQRFDLARLYEGAAAVLTRLLMSPGPSAARPLT
jgi:hypothetical protein